MDTEYVDPEPFWRNFMDDIVKRVEKLKEQAIVMEQEKDPFFKPSYLVVA